MPDGFFESYPSVSSPHLPPAYYPGLPSPLNYVEQMGGGYLLGDGSFIPSGSELERIYAEQKVRMSGLAEPEPGLAGRPQDRLRNGQVPLAAQLTKGVPELDPTCHPFGGWELDPGYPFYPERTQRYETQVTRAPGIDYVVRNPGEKAVKFDGCAVWDPRHELLEAKGPGYAGLFDRADRSTFGPLLSGSLRGQANRQVAAARGRPIDWHVAEPLAAVVFKNGIVGERPISVVTDPAR